MNRAELSRDIRDVIGCGGTISKCQIAKYLNISRNKKEKNDISKYIEGLSYIPDGRGNRYFVKDVAGRILENAVQR